MAKERNHSIDLLRFICMAMIVVIHYLSHGGILSASGIPKGNYLFANSLYVFCRVSVNCFFMITGYFLIMDSTRRISLSKQFKKVFPYWLELLSFSVIGTLIAPVFTGGGYTAAGIIKSFFPIYEGQWWFMAVFILLLLIKPFIERMLSYVSSDELKVLLTVLGIFDSLLPLLNSPFWFQDGYGIFHAVFMLLIGYAIRIKLINISNRKKALILYIICCVLAGGVSVVERLVLHEEDAMAACYNSPFIILGSIGLFVFVSGLHIRTKFFSVISPYVVGIYLVNDHPNLTEGWWKFVFHNEEFYSSPLMPLHLVGCVCAFIVIGLVLDWLFKKIVVKLVSKLAVSR